MSTLVQRETHLSGSGSLLPTVIGNTFLALDPFVTSARTPFFDPTYWRNRNRHGSACDQWNKQCNSSNTGKPGCPGDLAIITRPGTTRASGRMSGGPPGHLSGGAGALPVGAGRNTRPSLVI